MLTAEDHLAILRLYAAYNQAIDAGHSERWAETFTVDGKFHHPAQVYEGTDQLRAFVEARHVKLSDAPISDQQHWNDPINLEGDRDQATGRCSLIVAGVANVDGRPVIAARGHYHDRLVRTSAGWRFAERRLSIL